jgi:hypothetical protein
MRKRLSTNLRLGRFLGLFFFFLSCLIPIDRYFFKNNASFSIRFLYTSMPNCPEWDISCEQDPLLDSILSQDFTYLAKGTHCYAFVSQDQKYIIKFHRYPSHMRLFPWLNRPLAYVFDAKRIRIKEYNLDRYSYFMNNYKTSFQDLKEETGVILLHINRTDNLKKTITLIDKTKNRYRVCLDQVTFILQHRANMIYPTLQQCLDNDDLEKAKEAISHVISLIVQSCQKGYVNNDPVLKRNYGLLADRAMYIDIGDLVRKEEIRNPENYIPHLREVTQDLRAWIIDRKPELLQHFEEEVNFLPHKAIGLWQKNSVSVSHFCMPAINAKAPSQTFVAAPSLIPCTSICNQKN